MEEPSIDFINRISLLCQQNDVQSLSDIDKVRLTRMLKDEAFERIRKALKAKISALKQANYDPHNKELEFPENRELALETQLDDDVQVQNATNFAYNEYDECVEKGDEEIDLEEIEEYQEKSTRFADERIEGRTAEAEKRTDDSSANLSSRSRGVLPGQEIVPLLIGTVSNQPDNFAMAPQRAAYIYYSKGECFRVLVGWGYGPLHAPKGTGVTEHQRNLDATAQYYECWASLDNYHEGVGKDNGTENKIVIYMFPYWYGKAGRAGKVANYDPPYKGWDTKSHRNDTLSVAKIKTWVEPFSSLVSGAKNETITKITLKDVLSRVQEASRHGLLSVDQHQLLDWHDHNVYEVNSAYVPDEIMNELYENKSDTSTYWRFKEDASRCNGKICACDAASQARGSGPSALDSEEDQEADPTTQMTTAGSNRKRSAPTTTSKQGSRRQRRV